MPTGHCGTMWNCRNLMPAGHLERSCEAWHSCTEIPRKYNVVWRGAAGQFQQASLPRRGATKSAQKWRDLHAAKLPIKRKCYWYCNYTLYQKHIQSNCVSLGSALRSDTPHLMMKLFFAYQVCLWMPEEPMYCWQQLQVLKDNCTLWTLIHWVSGLSESFMSCVFCSGIQRPFPSISSMPWPFMMLCRHEWCYHMLGPQVFSW